MRFLHLACARVLCMVLVSFCKCSILFNELVCVCVSAFVACVVCVWLVGCLAVCFFVCLVDCLVLCFFGWLVAGLLFCVSFLYRFNTFFIHLLCVIYCICGVCDLRVFCVWLVCHFCVYSKSFL